MAEYRAGDVGSYGVERAAMPTVPSRSSNSAAIGGATSARKAHVPAGNPLSRMGLSAEARLVSDEFQ